MSILNVWYDEGEKLITWVHNMLKSSFTQQKVLRSVCNYRVLIKK